jgi:hypothetical protein
MPGGMTSHFLLLMELKCKRNSHKISQRGPWMVQVTVSMLSLIVDFLRKQSLFCQPKPFSSWSPAGPLLGPSHFRTDILHFPFPFA